MNKGIISSSEEREICYWVQSSTCVHILKVDYSQGLGLSSVEDFLKVNPINSHPEELLLTQSSIIGRSNHGI